MELLDMYWYTKEEAHRYGMSKNTGPVKYLAGMFTAVAQRAKTQRKT
jgi:hypothetical protein